MSGWAAYGPIYIEPWTPRAIPSISCCRRSVMPWPRNRFLQIALWRVGGRRPRVINVDGHAAYPRAIRELKVSGELGQRCRCRPTPYLNNVLEQDHRFVKRRMTVSLWFRSVGGALRTIAGYEAMNMIRKGQIRWLAKGDVAGQVRYIEQTLGLTA